MYAAKETSPAAQPKEMGRKEAATSQAARTSFCWALVWMEEKEG